MKRPAIDKGVPIPPRKPKKTQYVYPYEQMKLHDSFFVPGTSYEVRNRVSAAMHYWRKQLSPRKFEMRVLTSGIRVWRVK